MRDALIKYLLEHNEGVQKTLVAEFLTLVPNNIKSKDSIIRKVLDDEQVFVKSKIGNKDVRITLQPNFLKNAAPVKDLGEHSPTVHRDSSYLVFTWDSLKNGIIRELIGQKEVDLELSMAVDNVFRIIRGGREEFQDNATFKSICYDLFRYLNGPTSNTFRHNLCHNLLNAMETYLKLFYKQKFGIWLEDKIGFGSLRFFFMEEGLIPDKNARYLPENELKVYLIADRINKARNIEDHPKEFKDLSEKQISTNINDCLTLMVYLAKQL